MSETEVNLGQQEIYNNGSYVRIEDDQMTAWIFLVNPDTPYTKEEIYNFLKQRGVVRGFHKSNVAAIVKKHVYEREIRVAIGKPNDKGMDGYYQYIYSPEEYMKPKILEDGSADYTSMKVIHVVEIGDEVAQYFPAVQGDDGYSVTGIEMRARLVENLPWVPGEGVEVDPETGVYHATIKGKVEIVNSRVDVKTVHEVDGDVDLLTGSIDFNGDVLIHGSVEAGVTIKAAGNIEIHGSVEAADISAGGNLLLSRGIHGAQKSKITAKGSIFAEFIEHTTVEAGGDIRANSLVNSEISVDGKIVLTGRGRRGAIVGGYIHALQGIEANSIGNDAEVRTSVHVGFPPEDQKKLYTYRKSEAEIERNLSETSDKLEAAQKSIMSANSHSPMLQQRAKELKAEKDKYFKELTDVRIKMGELNDMIEKGKDATVMIDGNIYRGTVVGVNSQQINIEHNTCYMRYFAVDGKMDSNVIIK